MALSIELCEIQTHGFVLFAADQMVYPTIRRSQTIVHFSRSHHSGARCVLCRLLLSSILAHIPVADHKCFSFRRHVRVGKF